MSDRKVVLNRVMSLDGFVTSPDGTHEWMFEFFGDDSGEWNRRALDDAGVHAMGRRSYDPAPLPVLHEWPRRSFTPRAA